MAAMGIVESLIISYEIEWHGRFFVTWMPCPSIKITPPYETDSKDTPSNVPPSRGLGDAELWRVASLFGD